MVFNFFIHNWLGEIGLILLIMSKSSIANYINEDVFLEFLAISDCNFNALIKNIRFVCVDMDDWSINCLGYLSAVIRGSRLIGKSCKSNLIIKDNMDNTSWTVIYKILKTKWFPNNALASYGCISVNDYS